MRMWFRSAVAASMFCVVTPTFGDDVFGGSAAPPLYQDASNPNGTWSGSLEDLQAIVAQAEATYGHFEDPKHLGRNATMLVPATLAEMEREIARGNDRHWKDDFWNGAHGSEAESDDGLLMMGTKSVVNWVKKAVNADSGVVKYTNPNGNEVVYNLKTGKIVSNEKMGTRNFNAEGTGSSTLWGGHRQQDMDPHTTRADPEDPYSRDGDQYKYVGILYERDPSNPDKFYLVDGQTGRRLTKRQAQEFPTTLGDMWREQGLICVSNDANDVPEPQSTIMDEYLQIADQGSAAIDTVIDTAKEWMTEKSAARETQAPVLPDADAVAAPTATTSPHSYETVDYRALKQWEADLLNNTYATAAGMADRAGVGAEYRSRAEPIVNQGLNYIQNIPDQVQVPVGQ